MPRYLQTYSKRIFTKIIKEEYILAEIYPEIRPLYLIKNQIENNKK
jgi:hypothetical protein